MPQRFRSKKTGEKAQQAFLDLKITRGTAAELLGVTRMTISNLEKDGFFVADEKGLLTNRKLIEGWTRYLRNRKTSDRLVDDKKVRELKIEEMELKLARQRSELAPVNDLKTFLLNVVGQYHTKISSVPARYTRDLVDRTRLQEMLDDAASKFILDTRKGRGLPEPGVDPAVSAAKAKAGRVGGRAPRVPRDVGSSRTT